MALARNRSQDRASRYWQTGKSFRAVSSSLTWRALPHAVAFSKNSVISYLIGYPGETITKWNFCRMRILLMNSSLSSTKSEASNHLWKIYKKNTSNRKNVLSTCSCLKVSKICSRTMEMSLRSFRTRSLFNVPLCQLSWLHPSGSARLQNFWCPQ